MNAALKRKYGRLKPKKRLVSRDGDTLKTGNEEVGKVDGSTCKTCVCTKHCKNSHIYKAQQSTWKEFDGHTSLLPPKVHTIQL